MKKTSALLRLQSDLRKFRNPEKARFLQGYFKTGPGEYAQGDIFIGVTVFALRSLAQQYQALSFSEILSLLKSPIHEERLLSLLILIHQYRKGSQDAKEKIYRAYLAHTSFINHWDLVDVTAKNIVGDFLKERSRAPLYVLARSRSLWERRIAILATFHFIDHNDFKDSLRIARILLTDSHDLIHKAVGWMLREIGKKDRDAQESFLKKYYRRMPRTMLRYAIERFEEARRQAYLKGRV